MMAFEFPFEGMQPKPRQVHVPGRLARMKPGQDQPQPFSVLGPDAPIRPRFEKSSQPLVTKTGNHLMM